MENMEEKVLKYFMKDLECSEEVSKNMLEKLKLEEDIYNEFLYWFECKKFKTDNPIEIDGYTAKKLFEKFDILEIGAFNLLVSLRTDHDRTLEYINMGLPE